MAKGILPTKRKDPSKTSGAHDTMKPRLALVNALMGGTEALRAAGETYLPRHEAETQKNFENRLGRATLVNYFKRSVKSLVGKPFSNAIVVGEDMAPQLSALVEDIDHEGNHLNVFAQQSFESGLSKGITHILVEYPNTQAADVQTLADEQAINATPYFIQIEPENILAAYAEIRNGAEVLTHVRIYETETLRDGFEETVIERVRILEPRTWQLWRKMSDKRWELEEDGATSLDYIPLVTFYADKNGFMEALPPLIDLAYLNLAHYQSSSDQSNILTVARFPILAGSGLNSEEAIQKIGPRQMLNSVNENGKFYYVEHTGKAIEAGREDLKAMEEQMSILGIELLKKSGDATATAKAIDSAENLSMLQALILIYSDMLEQAFAIAAEYMGLGEESVGSIKINSDFGLSMDDAVDIPAIAAARASGDISRAAYLKELQRRGTLSEDYDAEKDLAEIDADKKKEVDNAAFEYSMQQQDILPGGPKDPNSPSNLKKAPAGA